MFRRKGFTLLELIIVIIVIGILASIALPRFIKVTEKARTAEAKSGLSAARSAQLRYFAQYGNYASNLNNTDASLQEKYFTFTAGSGSASQVGRASRTAVDNSLGGAGVYNITISEDGFLNISTGFEYLL